MHSLGGKWRDAAGTAMLVCALVGVCRGQRPADEASPLLLEPQQPATALEADVKKALDAHDYGTAEKLLLDEIARAPKTERSARLLEWIGSIYFENHDPMSAAIAWKKAEAIHPLDARLRFSLAMAYVAIERPEWARRELEKLAAAEPANALYVYWLGRLDYDGHLYPAAEKKFEQAIALDPALARAWDNLGLVQYYLNRNEEALKSFHRAIELGQGETHPSAWPYLNLAITEQFLNRLADAEAHLRQAIRLDGALPQAHFQLGTVLEDAGRLEEAAAELKEAARLDAAYQEPHMALARLYHKMGQEEAARQEVEIYRRLHSGGASQR